MDVVKMALIAKKKCSANCHRIEIYLYAVGTQEQKCKDSSFCN
jgi:hypothetical protein